MKDANIWKDNCPVTIINPAQVYYNITPEWIKQIQLDAWKQGMSDAAEICKEWEYAQFATEDIIDKRDAKTNV